MADCTEIKIKLDALHGLFLKKNEKGLDGPLLQGLEEIKKKFSGAPWLALLKAPATENQERLIEFAESRRCLIAALKKVNLAASNSTKNSSLKEIHVSLSHTKAYSAAFAVYDSRQIIEGVGLDIESKDREIKSEVKAKFVFDFEERLNLTPLELWTIKEASFKANSNANSKNAGTLFQFQIDEYDPDRREGKTVLESEMNSTSFQIHYHLNLLITIAMAQD